MLARDGHNSEDYSPWYFPTVEAYRERLEAGGFVVDSIETFARPTPIPGDVRAWLQTFAESFARAAPGQRRFFDDVHDLLIDELREDDGSWTVDYVRLRFAAHRS